MRQFGLCRIAPLTSSTCCCGDSLSCRPMVGFTFYCCGVIFYFVQLWRIVTYVLSCPLLASPYCSAIFIHLTFAQHILLKPMTQLQLFGATIHLPRKCDIYHLSYHELIQMFPIRNFECSWQPFKNKHGGVALQTPPSF